MDILFLTTELFPWVKVGGLADVASALPKALRGLGHRITVVMPKFPAFDDCGLFLARRLTPLQFAFGDETREAVLYDTRLSSQVDLVLVECGETFRTDALYDDSEAAAHRFALFSRAAIAMAMARPEPFDAIHANDWMTALAGTFAKDLGLPSRVVLTVHNVAHQGVFPRETLPKLGLSWDRFNLEGIEFYGKVNILKQGILSADAVATVSPSYAKEILAEPGGHGLSGVLSVKKPAGILNGIDYAIWNPATDAHLPARFDPENTTNKLRCRTTLQRELGLAMDTEVPLVAFVGRLTAQKGVDVLVEALPELLRSTEAQVVIAGEGDAKDVALVQAAASRFADRVVFARNASEPLVHRIFAGAAVVVVPSRFEPCGLVQMYAQRYGAVPVAHATGGLEDTIVDVDRDLETGTGVLFQPLDAAELTGAVQRALSAMAHPRFGAFVRRIMRLDRGWDRAARQYEKVYRTP
jgi:starch synthase